MHLTDVDFLKLSLIDADSINFPLIDVDTSDEITSDPDIRDMDARNLHMATSSSVLDEVKRALGKSKRSVDQARIEASLVKHLMDLSTGRSTRRRSMAKVLPSETLSNISHFLDVGSLRTYRLVCRAFERAAWPAFAESFNDNIFLPTEKSLKGLKALANNTTFVPYLKQLKIGTIKVIPADEKVNRANMACLMNERPNLTPGQVQWALEREERLRLSQMLGDALAKLVYMETICIVNCDDRRIFQASQAASDREWVVDYKGHRHALEIVFNAICYTTIKTDFSHSMPSLRNFTTDGRMMVSALPACDHRALNDYSTLYRDCAYPLTQITHLDLAITHKLREIDCEMMMRPLKNYVSDFLNSMPNVTTLSLQFDRPNYRATQPHRSHDLRMANEAFQAIANSVHLPQLKTLHLAHLALSLSTPLLDFLSKHRATLSSLKFTCLGLSFLDWRPFMRFLSERVDLQEFTMASDMSAEEERVSDAGWKNIPEDLALQAEDYQRACKNGTRFVSKDGTEEVFKVEEAES